MIRVMHPSPNQTASAQPRPARRTITHNLFHYIPGVFFRGVVGLLNTLLRPKLLTPQWFGLWSLLKVIPDYTSYLHLGARTGMRISVPRLIANKDDEALHTTVASAFWGSLIPNAGVSAALLILAACGHYSTELRIGLAAMAALIILDRLYEHCAAVLQGHQMFRELSRVMYLRNGLQLVLSIPLMLYLGLYGLLIALPASYVVALLYLQSLKPMPLAGRFSRSAYLELVKLGIPLMGSSFLATLIITSGRLLVAVYLTTEEVGYYALGTLLVGSMLRFPEAARQVVEPRVLEKADTLHDHTVLDNYLFRPLAISACYTPLIIAPLFFLIPVLIAWFLPRYTLGIIPMQIFLFGFYFRALSYPLNNIIVAYRLQKDLAILTALSLLVDIGLSLYALKAGFGIIGVAVATSATYAVLLLLLATLLRRRRGIRFPLAKIWPIVVSFLLLCVSIVASRLWLQPWVGDGVAGALAQSVVLFGAGLLLLTVAEPHASLLKGLSPLSILRTIARKALKL